MFNINLSIVFVNSDIDILLCSILFDRWSVQFGIFSLRTSECEYGISVSDIPCMINVGQFILVQFFKLSNASWIRQLTSPTRSLAMATKFLKGEIRMTALGFLLVHRLTVTPVPIDRPMMMILLSLTPIWFLTKS